MTTWVPCCNRHCAELRGKQQARRGKKRDRGQPNGCLLFAGDYITFSSRTITSHIKRKSVERSLMLPALHSMENSSRFFLFPKKTERAIVCLKQKSTYFKLWEANHAKTNIVVATRRSVVVTIRNTAIPCIVIPVTATANTKPPSTTYRNLHNSLRNFVVFALFTNANKGCICCKYFSSFQVPPINKEE